VLEKQVKSKYTVTLYAWGVVKIPACFPQVKSNKIPGTLIVILSAPVIQIKAVTLSSECKLT
jgi:hypothetical protein